MRLEKSSSLPCPQSAQFLLIKSPTLFILPDFLYEYRHTSETSRFQFQTTAIKQVYNKASHTKIFGFPLYIKVIFTLYYSLLSV